MKKKAVFIMIMFFMFMSGASASFQGKGLYQIRWDPSEKKYLFNSDFGSLDMEFDIYKYVIKIDKENNKTKDSFNGSENVLNCSNLGAIASCNGELSNDQIISLNIFEENTKYYMYIGRTKNGSSYEIFDGPVEIDISKDYSYGERISIEPFTNTSVFVWYNNNHIVPQGKDINKGYLYVGEIDNESILKELAQNNTDSSASLMEYAKSKLNNLKQEEFEINSDGVIGRNVFENYTFSPDKYYFVYCVMDDDNGKWVTIDDVQAFNYGAVNYLKPFKYNLVQNESDLDDKDKDYSNTTTKVPETTKASEKVENPKTGVLDLSIMLVFIIISIIGFMTFTKNTKYFEK